MEEEDFQGKFGSLYEEINPKSKNALLYNVIFMFRRLIIAITALFLQSTPAVQIHITVLLSLFMLCYLLLGRTFSDPFFKKLDIFNEVCILLSSYHLYLYSDYLDSITLQYSVGWSMIAVTLFNIASNVMVVVVCTAVEVIRKIRRCCKKRLRGKDQAATVGIKPIKIDEEKETESDPVFNST